MDFGEDDKKMIWEAAHTVPAVDVRTRLDPRRAGCAGDFGLDSLLTTPAVLEEFFRRRAMARRDARVDAEAGAAHEAYIRSLTPGELADIIWRQLFLDHPPLSEATRAVLTTMGLFGLDVGIGDLRLLREQFEAIPEDERRDRILKLANLDLVLYSVDCMDAVRTESVPPSPGPAFKPVLCLDSLLWDWRESARLLRQRGYGLKAKVDEFSAIELRRLLAAEMARVNPVALNLDWPDGVRPGDDGVGRLVREAVAPLCRERGMALLLSPQTTQVDVLAPLWEDNPEVRFMLFPAGAEQAEAALEEARFSRNLLLCGPDGTLRHPSRMEDAAARRLEALGSGFHYAHSEAETAEGLVGAWAHLRWNLGKALLKRYGDLWRTGWRYEEADVLKDVRDILGGNARTFLGTGTVNCNEQ